MQDSLFFLNVRKHVFPVKVTEHYQRLPRKVVGSPFLGMLKSHLNAVLSCWL